MFLFTAIIQKLSLVYANILIGFCAGKTLKIESSEIAKLIFFVTTPFVILGGVLKIDINLQIISVPFLVLLVCSLLAVIFYHISKLYYDNSVKNIIGLSAGSCNSGFVGIPLITILTNNDDHMVGSYITATMGVAIYENSTGFIIASLDDKIISLKAILARLLKLPTLYSFIVACGINLLGVRYHNLPIVLQELITLMSNCYLALGTLIIGIAIAQVEKIRIDFKFVCLTFIAKFIAWPLLIQIIIISDKYFFKFFNDTIYYILTILSVVPLATNIVTLASLLKIDPGKAASAVLLGVLFAALYIPIALKILL